MTRVYEDWGWLKRSIFFFNFFLIITIVKFILTKFSTNNFLIFLITHFYVTKNF